MNREQRMARREHIKAAIREDWWPEHVTLTREPDQSEERTFAPPPPPRPTRTVQVSGACSLTRTVDDSELIEDPHYYDNPAELRRAAVEGILRPEGLRDREMGR